MASLHRDSRGKSPFWYCAFTQADGTRCFKSTKKTKRKDAEEVARGWQRAVDLARGGALTEIQVRKIIDEIYERANGEALNFASTADFLKQWTESKELTAAKSTARRYRDVLVAFAAQLGPKAQRSLGAITPADIAAFRDLQVKEGKANKTANMAVKTLRIAFNVARRQGMILANPAEAVDSLPENSATRDTFTRDQIKALLAVVDNEWRGMILFGAYHGLRLGDAARLTWANMDMERKSIRFYPQKERKRGTRHELEIPMHPDVEDYLLALPVRSNRPDAPIFPALSRKKGTGANGLSNTFTNLMVKAEIYREAARDKVEGKGRRVFGLSFHSLRHTAISELANSGVSKERRMLLSGHKSNVHERYTHHDLESLRGDVERVKSLVKPDERP
ncbi:MAG: tyrosine-type recombinase/integrase [Limisphaerales bacterium]